MDQQDLAALAGATCINVRSFRRDGTPVDTPLWVVAIDGLLASYTDDRSYKVRRVRRNPQVEVAGSDVWGIPSTPWYPARCQPVHDPRRREQIFAAIAQKYGFHWTMALWGSRLSFRIPHRVVLEFEVELTPVGA